MSMNYLNYYIANILLFFFYREEWRQLFFKHNIKELRKHALFGHLRASRFRSLCWFLLLDILPEDSSTWLEELSKIRKLYKNVKDNLSCDPWNNKSAIDDPLSQNDNVSIFYIFYNCYKKIIKFDF